MDDDPCPPRLKIVLTEDSCIGSEELKIQSLERCALHLLDVAGVEESELAMGLHVCDAAQMAEIHGQFMDDPTPTDVMAFEGDESAPDYLGDVVVCLDVAREEATHHGHSDMVELQFYVMHGILHLLGYDDASPEDREEMHRHQKDALKLEHILVQS